MVPNHARYHLRYTPESFLIIRAAGANVKQYFMRPFLKGYALCGGHTLFIFHSPGGAYTVCAFMRLVLPARPIGTPAVMTTMSPLLTTPSLSEVCTHMEKSLSVEST